MTKPKQKLDGPTSLGKAIDQRVRQQEQQLDIRHGLGRPTAASQASGTSPGGGGGTSEPATPEEFVSTLRLTDSGTKRQGDIVLKHSGIGSLAEDTVSSDRRFTWTGKTLADVATLPGSPDTQTVYHLTTTDTLHWHDGSGWRKLMFAGDALVTPVAAKDAAYTATAADGVLLCSGTWILDLSAASGCSGLHLWIRNTGGGTITIDPDGAEEIDGATTLALGAGESAHIVCDGSDWWSL